ncbi:Transmembrane protein 19 [Yarrowia sp. C11]|nr:Transmembrane protein 19 [Yarrowia sp. C11]KAG5364274.1 Transmembrane protein 19 [Yarrowia sp. E02]
MHTGKLLRVVALVEIARRAHKNKSLTPAGIVAAVITGIIHAVHPWSVCMVLLFAFYVPSSKFTKMKADFKSTLTETRGDHIVTEIQAAKDERFEKSDPRSRIKTKRKVTNAKEKVHETRTVAQVLCNSVFASILLLLHYYFKIYKSPEGRQSKWDKSDWLMVGFIAHYAVVTADTFSSELGILSKYPPILITTFQPCPKGTNGGISPLGCMVALAGGLYIGIVTVLVVPLGKSWKIADALLFILFMGSVGLCGSLLDSLLGALFQKSVVNEGGKIVEMSGGRKVEQAPDLKSVAGADILSNNQVNLTMAVTASCVTMALWKMKFP